MVHVLLFKMAIACKGLWDMGLTFRWNFVCLKAYMVKAAQAEQKSGGDEAEDQAAISIRETMSSRFRSFDTRPLTKSTGG